MPKKWYSVSRYFAAPLLGTSIIVMPPLPLMHSRRVVGWLVGQLDAQERRPEVFAAAETISQEMNAAPSSVHNLGISK